MLLVNQCRTQNLTYHNYYIVYIRWSKAHPYLLPIARQNNGMSSRFCSVYSLGDWGGGVKAKAKAKVSRG
jgi:hypothetical protein